MPPFPWHFGGQRYQNIFVYPEEIAQFCESNQMKVCFDISHSKLACNHFKRSMIDYIGIIGPYISHMHIADAAGVDGEGLQIGFGDIDFEGVSRQLRFEAPHASFIPEIWQGHKNNGEGFWRAFELLEKYF
jgi:sugar phosphate isomerase/epimerase